MVDLIIKSGAGNTGTAVALTGSVVLNAGTTAQEITPTQPASSVGWS